MGEVEDVVNINKCKEEIHMTVMKTSLFCTSDGFSVYDSDARLVFRVDSCGGNRELVLMDLRGRCLFSLRRKWTSLHQRWEGYAGEFKEDRTSKPLFGVRRSSMIGRSEVTVEMYTPPGVHEYQIEGSFAQRSCTIYESFGGPAVAEIRRKLDSGANMVLGKDVFLLSVKPGFDAAFAMALVIALDQITDNSTDDEDARRPVIESQDTIDEQDKDPRRVIWETPATIDDQDKDAQRLLWETPASNDVDKDYNNDDKTIMNFRLHPAKGQENLIDDFLSTTSTTELEIGSTSASRCLNCSPWT
ncbi:hypothetical protein V2J09_004576 [Rumex salicifolius]